MSLWSVLRYPVFRGFLASQDKEEKERERFSIYAVYAFDKNVGKAIFEDTYVSRDVSRLNYNFPKENQYGHFQFITIF